MKGQEMEQNQKQEQEQEETNKKYIVLLSTINEIEKRMGWTELVYLTLNLVIFLFVIGFISFLMRDDLFSTLELLFVLLSLVVGMSICSYWSVSAIRLQLRLKLRYFQARFLERKMQCVGEYLLSDESIFFEPTVRHLESADGKEHLYYPTKGLSRMDGFIGAAKPRYFSWLLPIMFFVFYWVIFIWMIIKAIS